MYLVGMISVAVMVTGGEISVVMMVARGEMWI